jgi:hypothetical protein
MALVESRSCTNSGSVGTPNIGRSAFPVPIENRLPKSFYRVGCRLGLGERIACCFLGIVQRSGGVDDRRVEIEDFLDCGIGLFARGVFVPI